MPRTCLKCLEELSFNNKTGLCYTHYQEGHTYAKRAKRKAYRDYLCSLGCACCGENHFGTLEVHHLHSSYKRYGRSQGSSHNREDLDANLAIVLCANCHSIFHFHFGGKNSNFTPQTKESTVAIINLERNKEREG